MKTLFLLLEFLTGPEAIRNVLQSCFTAAVVSVAVLSSLGGYQALRHSFSRRNTSSPSRA
jgi:hypothetical protein